MKEFERYNPFSRQQIPLTRVKLLIARILYFLIHHFLRKDQYLIQRKGVSYTVDLSEGIDLSLFLFGNFQSYINHNKALNVPEDAVIFDIGANIGSMAFKFAQLTPDGHVYAFEPTAYAYHKLIRNIALNPELAQRITPVQVFVSDRTRTDHGMHAYASWKVDGSAVEKHPVHGGTIKAADLIPAITLDDFCLKHAVPRVDLIKIDTDGHEFEVLTGAHGTLENHLPYLIFEMGLYVLKEQHLTFAQYFDYLSAFDYKLINAKNGRAVTMETFEKQIPWQSTTDIIGIPPQGCRPKR
jgi:FkbM family methyltransferase